LFILQLEDCLLMWIILGTSSATYSTKITTDKIVQSLMLTTLLFRGSWFLSMLMTEYFRSALNSMYRFAFSPSLFSV
jgi:hypothetical protein